MFGTIYDYNKARGFGFISLDSDRRVFFHISNYHGEAAPTQGWRVEFDLAPANMLGDADQAVRIVPVEMPVGGGL